MKILALTDGSVKSATALDAFDGRTQVDMHVPLAPLPASMMKPDIVIMSFVDFPEYGMKPLLDWLEKHDLSQKPRILCMPKSVARQFSASVRLFADKLLPLPVRPDVILDAMERMDTRLPQLRRQQRNETVATVQSTARKFISAFSTEDGDTGTTVIALSAATKDVCSALEKDGLVNWLDEVNNYHSSTARHCMQVAGLASVWAQQLGVSEKDNQLFTRGALLHDIGKMRIPLEILDKAGPLTPEERAIIETHPTESKKILEAGDNVNPMIVDLAYSHHEFLDGSGYPRGLKASQINDMVHCLTIVDIYSAMIDPRAYKGAQDPNDAYAYLQSIPEKLDQGLVGAFRPIVDMHIKQLAQRPKTEAA
ncbi:MAG: HD-GYP domain-containing protein [Devosiaceae bacterium]